VVLNGWLSGRADHRCRGTNQRPRPEFGERQVSNLSDPMQGLDETWTWHVRPALKEVPRSKLTIATRPGLSSARCRRSCGKCRVLKYRSCHGSRLSCFSLVHCKRSALSFRQCITYRGNALLSRFRFTAEGSRPATGQCMGALGPKRRTWL
jgi:hypothetical protein